MRHDVLCVVCSYVCARARACVCVCVRAWDFTRKQAEKMESTPRTPRALASALTGAVGVTSRSSADADVLHLSRASYRWMMVATRGSSDGCQVAALVRETHVSDTLNRHAVGNVACKWSN
jgi:hypothetical protein